MRKRHGQCVIQKAKAYYMNYTSAPTVALERCSDYSPERVERALDRALYSCGGLDSVIRPGMRVLIKCNLVARKGPECAATTHPEIVRALCARVKELGAHPIIGDSPGGPLNAALLKSYYAATGMADAAQRAGAELSLDDGQGVRQCPEGRALKCADLTNMVLKADAVISCSKLKTHGMTLMTGCVKNLFGCVPGVTKVEYHARFSQLKRFSDMLVDLERCVRPVFNVLDAVECMEGEGPTGGNARHLGALLVSRDAHAIDLIGAELMGVRPGDVCTLARAMERGLLCPDDVRVAGERVDDVRDGDFTLPQSAKDVPFYSTVPVIGRLVNAVALPRPRFSEDKCVRCGVCERSCPAHAITLAPFPRADMKLCIRCFCCQELCPHHAVAVRKSLLRHVLR